MPTIAEEEIPASSVTLKEKTKIILPFEYAEDEHYYVESLGEIKKKPFLISYCNTDYNQQYLCPSNP